MSCPSSRPLSFNTELVRLNRLHELGFQHWSFLPGMLFGAATTWWSATGTTVRPLPHEGLDLYSFVGEGGLLASLKPGALIPVLARGEVMAIFADFLGHSILVAHDLEQGGARFYSLYGHVTAAPGLGPGHQCQEGEVIARIAVSRRAGVPAHLHLSTLWHSGRLAGELSWPYLNTAAGVHFCDPLECIGV